MSEFFNMRPNNTTLELGLVDLCRSSFALIPKDSTIVELGSYRGESTVIFASIFTESTICACDLWAGGYTDWNDIHTTPDVMQLVEKDYLKRVKPFRNIRTFKADSIELASKFEDDTISMIYIDTEHTYTRLKAEIEAWWPKLKNFGVLAGHDFEPSCKGVMQAVVENFGRPDNIFVDFSWMVVKR